MKRTIKNILFGLMFLIGFGVLVYPIVSDQWNTYRQSQLITIYDSYVEELDEEDFSEHWKAAKAFNDTFTENNIYADVFGTEETGELEDSEYWQVLNLSGSVFSFVK